MPLDLLSIDDLLADHLRAHNYSRALEGLAEDIALDLRRRLLTLFDAGSRQSFFQLYGKFKCKDEVLQFQLRVYFLVYSIHPARSTVSPSFQQQKNTFSEFVACRGKQFAKHPRLLPYFSLAYLKDPASNPELAFIFSNQWIAGLRLRLVELLYTKSKLEKTLQQVGMQHTLKQGAVIGNPVLQIKWFTLAKQLVIVVERLVGHCHQNKVPLGPLEETAQSFIWFYNKSFIQAINCSIGSIPEAIERRLPHFEPELQFEGLAMDKVKRVLNSPDVEQAVSLLISLQNKLKALARTPISRRQFVILLEQADVLGLRDNSYTRPGSRLVQKEGTRSTALGLLRTLAADFHGFQWLGSNEGLVKQVCRIIKQRPKAGGMALTFLEKVSSSGKVKDLIMQSSLVEELVELLRERTDELLQDSAVSILLCLADRPDARKVFQGKDLMRLLIDTSRRTESVDSKTLVYAVIWLLIEKPIFKARALQLGLREICRANIFESDHPQRAIQSLHILRRIFGEDEETSAEQVSFVDNLLEEQAEECEGLVDTQTLKQFAPSRKEREAQRTATLSVLGEQIQAILDYRSVSEEGGPKPQRGQARRGQQSSGQKRRRRNRLQQLNRKREQHNVREFQTCPN